MLSVNNFNIFNKANKLLFSQPINFTIEAGEIWMLRGANGIGKSSLYESLIGLRPINFGEVSLKGVIVNNLSPVNRIKIGMKYVSQVNALFDDLSVLDNLKICAEFLLKKEDRDQKVEEAINLFELNQFAKRRINQLSGGQKRLAELSKIAIGECSIVLMDEPFAAIDEDKIEAVSNILVRLQKEKDYSFFINDHNLKAVEKISQKCLHITNSSTKIKILQG